MSKRVRQYIGILSAIIFYFIIHEGAHFIYSLVIGAFKRIKIIGLGMQIDVYSEKMTESQFGIFCLIGAVITLLSAYIFVFLIGAISRTYSKVFKACCYYITIALLIIDPLYLSLLCGFFGGGDMNGISLLIPELAARFIFSAILVINVCVFWQVVLPKYKVAFSDN